MTTLECKENDSINSNIKQPRYLTVPEFTVNLDESPEKRWLPVLNKYKKHLIQVRKVIQEFVKDNLGSTGLTLKSLASGVLSISSGALYYEKELKAIAKFTGMPLGNFQTNSLKRNFAKIF